MIYGANWDGTKVLARLIETFRRLPDAPIYSPTRFRFELLVTGPVDGLKLIAASAHTLGAGSEAHVWLLTRAACVARGSSLVALCRIHGWPRTRFYAVTDAAAGEVADALNRRASALLNAKVTPLARDQGET